MLIGFEHSMTSGPASAGNLNSLLCDQMLSNLHLHVGSFPVHFPVGRQVLWLSPFTNRKSYMQTYFTTEPTVVLCSSLRPYDGVPGSGHLLMIFAAMKTKKHTFTPCTIPCIKLYRYLYTLGWRPSTSRRSTTGSFCPLGRSQCRRYILQDCF